MAGTVLIVKLAAIGDVVMALPMVTALRSSASQPRIAWLCGRTVAPLLERVPAIDERIVVDDARLLGGHVADAVAVVLDAWRRLAGRRFDRVLVAHGDPRYRHLVRTLRAGTIRSLAGGDRPGIVPGRAHADEYVRLVTGLDDHRAPAFGFPRVDVTLPPALAGRLPDRPAVALAPGGARNPARDNPLRRWPVARYAELAARLVAAGRDVVVTGSPTDEWIRPHFAGMPVVDLVGATDLPGLVAVYRTCSAVVTHDSGPLHLAELAGVPRVALFGPTPPASFVRPAADVRVLWPAGGTLPCAPCYDGLAFARCDDNRCMQAIGVDDVLARLAEVERR